MQISKYSLIISILFTSFSTQATTCQENINQLKKIKIRILQKTPAMPTLSNLLRPINEGIRQAEDLQASGNTDRCIELTEKIINLMSGYTK